MKRVFLIILDSFGIGDAPDAADYGDAGSNTLLSCWRTGLLEVPVMAEMGLYHITGVSCGQPSAAPIGAYARMQEQSCGKDTTVGHWELAGVVSHRPFPTYPHGFPSDFIDEFARRTGRGVLCNQVYSGTQVIQDYGRAQQETGAWIVYTSADSVFQIAAHEDVIAPEELYRACRIARELLTGDHGVARVIARPYTGQYPNYTRTAGRHDYSLPPTGTTMLDVLTQAGIPTVGVGKIHDIFAGRGIGRSIPTKNNDDGMAQTLELVRTGGEGLYFVNLVEFDMVYGHRNDAPGYARALSRFDRQLSDLLPLLREEDLLMITADHGCDPGTPSTDHSRECVPLLIYGRRIRGATDLGTLPTFADVGASICDYFGCWGLSAGESFLPRIFSLDK